MAFCAQEINDYANNIWQDLGSPPTQSPSWIAAWVTVSGNLGKLNNALDTSYCITGGTCISPDPDPASLAIYEMLYKQQFYAGQQSSLLTSVTCGGMAGNAASSWTRMSEGDTTVVRSSASDIIRAFNAIVTENNKQLRLAIGDFKRNNSLPFTIDAASLASRPTP